MKGFKTIEIDRMSKIIEDYEVANEPMENRIEKWIYQFAPEDRSIILYELKHIFEKYYIDKHKYIKYLSEVNFKARETHSFGLWSKDKISFLNIQSSGSSQRDSLKLMEDFIMYDSRETLQDYGSAPERYVYVDDCLYTGQKLLMSIENWVQTIESGKELYIMFYAIHTKNIEFIKKRLSEILGERKIFCVNERTRKKEVLF